MLDIQERLAHLRERMPAMRLYALVDGVQYQAQFCVSFVGVAGSAYSLFNGTDDAALSNAGPWLLDAESAPAPLLRELGRLERVAPAVTWLISPLTPEGLGQLLQLRLDVQLPDGRKALLRFWDPRVLLNLIELLSADQREEFFVHIHEWHLLQDGRRVWMGRHDADLQ